MTVRIYLTAVRFDPGPPEPTDLPAERLFVHASEVSEIWVELELATAPDRGKAIAFALAWPMNIGFNRILGTVERVAVKRGRAIEELVAAPEAGLAAPSTTYPTK